MILSITPLHVRHIIIYVRTYSGQRAGGLLEGPPSQHTRRFTVLVCCVVIQRHSISITCYQSQLLSIYHLLFACACEGLVWRTCMYKPTFNLYQCEHYLFYMIISIEFWNKQTKGHEHIKSVENGQRSTHKELVIFSERCLPPSVCSSAIASCLRLCWAVYIQRDSAHAHTLTLLL